MNKMLKDQMQLEEDQAHMTFLSNFIAEMIHIHYKYLKNDDTETYVQIYNSCLQYFNHSYEQQKQIYENVGSILESKYNLIIANNKINEPMYLVNKSDRGDDIC